MKKVTKSTLKNLANVLLKGKSNPGMPPKTSKSNAVDLCGTPAMPGRPAQKLTVQELLESYRRSGDQAMAAKIFKDHWHLVLGQALRILNDRETAQDAAADIFLKVLSRLRLETPLNFSGWLYTVTRYHCFEIRRKEKRAPILEPLEGLRDVAEDLREGVLHACYQSSMEEEVCKALQFLPEHQRICIELFYLKDCSYKEICETAGYDIGEVKSFIQNGKRKLLHLMLPIRNRHVSDSAC